MSVAIELESLPQVSGMSATRRRLYSTAMVLFAERGYDAVSIRDITDTLGQQPGAFYTHARSKQDLLFELVRIGVIEHRDRLRAAVLNTANDPVEQLRAIVREQVFVHLDYPELARVFSRETRVLDPTQRTAVEAIITESRLLLLAVIARGEASGVFANTDTLLVASVLGDIGVRLPEWWTPDFPRSREQIADTYAEFALKILQ
jgi:AcrR family transcriptional regulator